MFEKEWPKYNYEYQVLTVVSNLPGKVRTFGCQGGQSGKLIRGAGLASGGHGRFTREKLHTETGDNANAMFQSYLSKPFKKETG